MVGKVDLEGPLGETSNTPRQTLSITLDLQTLKKKGLVKICVLIRGTQNMQNNGKLLIAPDKISLGSVLDRA